METSIYARKVLAWTVGGFVVPPLMWLLGSWYFQACTLEQTIALALTPLLWFYVIGYIGAVAGITIRHLKQVEACLAEPTPDRVLQAQRSLAFLPILFLVAIAVYCLIGPNTALYGKPFLDKNRYILDWFLGIPIIFLFSMPFFLSMLANLEKMAAKIPHSTEHKFLSLSARMVLIFSFTTLGSGFVLALGGLCIVYSSVLDNLFTVLATKLFFSALLITAIAALNLFLLMHHMLLPIKNIADATLKLVRGERLVDIDAFGRRDEVGDIANSLKTFAELMAERRALAAREESQKRQAEEERKAALRRLADGFEASVKGVVSAVSMAAGQLERTAQNMSLSADESNRQCTTVSAAAEQASANVQTVASATEELSSSVAEIGRQVAESTRIAGEAVAEATHTNATVASLQEAAQKIGAVVQLINQIASQTNLLALNATIEAARAGEAGKGFAVVASEVKNLATQTAKATEDIQAQVSQMQGVTDTTVTAIQSITGTIQRMNEIATTIASAVEEQSAATREISRNVQEASMGTQEVSSNISKVSRATDETRVGATETLAAAQSLNQHAESLGREVDRFVSTIQQG